MKVEELESFLLEQKFIQDRVASSTTKRVFELHSENADYKTVIAVAQPDKCQIHIGGRQVFDGALSTISYSDFEKLIDPKAEASSPEESGEKKDSSEESVSKEEILKRLIGEIKDLPPELGGMLLKVMGIGRSLEECLKSAETTLLSKGFKKISDGDFSFADGLISVRLADTPAVMPIPLNAWIVEYYSGVEHISMICPISSIDTLGTIATKLVHIAADSPLTFPKNDPDPMTRKFRKWHTEEIIRSLKEREL